jgi:hypothetical protein
MCKWNKYGDTRIDPCMRALIKNLNTEFGDGLHTVACCCGHGKYPLSILVKDKYGNVWDMASNELLPRKRRFYQRDKQGYYFIPEVVYGEAKS